MRIIHRAQPVMRAGICPVVWRRKAFMHNQHHQLFQKPPHCPSMFFWCPDPMRIRGTGCLGFFTGIKAACKVRRQCRFCDLETFT